MYIWKVSNPWNVINKVILSVGKFGISLLRGGDKHFVEGPNLYPQDRLVEVNGENVEGASNDRIYELFEVND